MLSLMSCRKGTRPKPFSAPGSCRIYPAGCFKAGSGQHPAASVSCQSFASVIYCLLQAAREQDQDSWEDGEKEQLRQQVQALQAAAEQAAQQAAKQAQHAAVQAQQQAAESPAPREGNGQAEAQLKARIAALEVG